LLLQSKLLNPSQRSMLHLVILLKFSVKLLCFDRLRLLHL
jgi:hypothetical protein